MALTKTQGAADALNAKFAKIGTMFNRGVVMALGGAALAAPLIMATNSAKEYIHQLNQMRSAGLDNKEMAESIAAAWATSKGIITSTAQENLRVIMDLRSVFGKTSEGIEYMPAFAKIQGAYSGILDGKLAKRADEQSFAMAKALDMIGKVNNRQEFNKAAEAMFRVTEATSGRVLPTDYQTTFKYMRQAKYGLNDHFLYKILPELILENKGGGSGSSGGVGPQIAALYRFGVQGIMNKRSAQQMQEMNMIPASSILKTTTSGTTLKGGVMGSEMLAANPFQWVQEVFLPHLEKKFHLKASETDKLIQASNQVFKGNQLATSLVAEFIKKPQQYSRFPRLYDKTMGIDGAYNNALKNDPHTSEKALHAQVKNLMDAVGKDLVPMVQAFNVGLAQTLSKVTEFVNKHPRIVQAVVAITAVTAGLLIVGGIFTIIAAGVSELVALGGAVAAALSAPVILPIIGIIAAIGAAFLAVKNWDKIVALGKKAMVMFEVGLNVFVANIAALAGKLGRFISGMPGMADAGMAIMQAATKAAQASAKNIEAGKKAFNEPITPVQASKGAAPQGNGHFFNPRATVINQTNNITMKEDKGHDHDKCWQYGTRKMAHTAAAASGNSTGRSINSGGSTRP